MIKLQDFANQKGVTDRAIQKHLKKYENELQGHFERKGPNGTWLDEYACDFISDLMKTNPVVLTDNTLLKRKEELEEKSKKLEEENKVLLKKIAAQAEMIAQLSSEKAENARALALAELNQLYLEEKTSEVKELKDALKEAREEADQKVKESNQRAFQAEQKVKEQKSELDKFKKAIFGFYRKRD